MAATAELPRHNMLLYASGSFAGNVISRTKDLWLIFFFAPPEDETDIARRSSILAVGAVLAVARVIESFDDPFIGYWSDRTRSRWGRRIPFVLFATPFGPVLRFLRTPPTAMRPSPTPSTCS
jgi:GPH family glycoside/pentoside/hexuronide:cation symporter